MTYWYELNFTNCLSNDIFYRILKVVNYIYANFVQLRMFYSN